MHRLLMYTFRAPQVLSRDTFQLPSLMMEHPVIHAHISHMTHVIACLRVLCVRAIASTSLRPQHPAVTHLSHVSVLSLAAAAAMPCDHVVGGLISTGHLGRGL